MHKRQAFISGGPLRRALTGDALHTSWKTLFSFISSFLMVYFVQNRRLGSAPPAPKRTFPKPLNSDTKPSMQSR